MKARVGAWKTSVEGEVDGGDGDEVRRVEQAELGPVRVVDDEPCLRHWQGQLLFARHMCSIGTHHSICSAPSCSSSLPLPVPQ